MNEQRKEVIGSYLMEEEALAKIDWLQSEGYQPEEIWIIRDNRGIVERFGDRGFSGASSEREAQLNEEYSSINPSSSIVTPKSLFTPENKSVAVTLMEMGIAKEEAYRYEFDVKVGKVLVLAEPISSMKLRQEALTESRMERYATEETSLQLEERTEPIVAEKTVVSEDERNERMPGSSTSINRPMPDTNIDGSIPLDEQLLSRDPVEMEKDYAREEVTALHDQASVTNEAPTMGHTRNPDLELEEKMTREQQTPTNNGKRFAENRSEEDVDKALLYEHGQPFPMEKPYEEDVYDQRVVADGPLGVELEETAGDMSRSQSQGEKPLFSSTAKRDQSTRPVDSTSSVSQEGNLTEDRGPILFEDTLNEIEKDEPLVDSYESTSYETEQPGDIYTPEEETSVHIDEETYMQEEDVRYTESNDGPLFEENNAEGPFSDRKKERMTQKRNNLFNDQDNDLFKR